MLWFLAVVSLVGTVLNAQQKRSGFLFWIAANSGWVIVDLQNGLPEQAALFVVYVALALYGFIAWGRKSRSLKTGTPGGSPALPAVLCRPRSSCTDGTVRSFPSAQTRKHT